MGYKLKFEISIQSQKVPFENIQSTSIDDQKRDERLKNVRNRLKRPL